MVDDNVTIRLEAIDDASPEVRRLIGDVERLKKSFSGLKGAKFELVDSGMLRQIRSMSTSSERAAAGITRQARATSASMKANLRDNRLRSQMRRNTDRAEEKSHAADLRRYAQASRFRLRQEAHELRERIAGVRTITRLMMAQTRQEQRSRRQKLSDFRYQSGLRRRHESEMAALRAGHRLHLIHSGRSMFSSGGRVTASLETGPLVIGGAAIGAAIAAGIRSAARDAVSLDRAETAARMHMDQGVLAAPQLRKWALDKSAAFGIGADQLLSTTVEASKAGVPDEMAQATAEMVVRLSKVFDMGLAETTQNIGYAIAQEFGAGRLKDITSVESLGNMAAFLAGKTSANPAQMLSFMRTGLGSGAGIGLSREATMAFGAAAIQAGGQGAQSARALGSIGSDLTGLTLKARAIREKGRRSPEDRLFMQIPQLLGYGSYSEIEGSLKDNPDEGLFALIKSFGKIEDLTKRNNALHAIFGDDFGRIVKNMVDAPAMLDRTLTLAREAKRQSGDQLWVRQAFLEYTKGFEFLIDQSRSVWTSLKAELGDALKPFVSDVRDWLTGWQKSIGSGGMKARFDAVLQGLTRGFGFERFRDLLAAFGSPGQFDMTSSIRAFEFAKGFAEGLRNVGTTVAAALKPLGSMIGLDASSAAGTGKTIATILGLSLALQAIRPATAILGAVVNGIFGIGNAVKFLNSALMVAGFTSTARMGAGFVGLGSAVLGRLGISIGAGLLSTLGVGFFGGGLAIAGVAVTMGALAVAVMNWPEIMKKSKEFLGLTPESRNDEKKALAESFGNARKMPFGPGVIDLFNRMYREYWRGPGIDKMLEADGHKYRSGSLIPSNPLRQLASSVSEMSARIQLASLTSSGTASAVRESFTPSSSALSGGIVDQSRMSSLMNRLLRGNGPVNPFGYGRRGAIGGGFTPSLQGVSRGNGASFVGGAPGQALFDAIIRAEGTGKRGNPYDTSLGYLKSPKPLTQMTMNEALSWGDFIRKQTPIGLKTNSSAKGAFQIVNTTQRAAMKALGIGGNELFDEENQRRMAAWIARKQGLGAWEGFKFHPAERRRAAAAMAAGVNTAGPSKPAMFRSKVPDILAPTVPKNIAGPQDAAGLTKDVPINSSGQSAGGRFNGVPGGYGAGGGGSGPVTIHINGSNSDPEALATLVQRRINESMNWRTHDMEYDV